jgi:hypothetical protein
LDRHQHEERLEAHLYLRIRRTMSPYGPIASDLLQCRGRYRREADI